MDNEVNIEASINARRLATEEGVMLTESQMAYTKCVVNYEKGINATGTVCYGKLSEQVADSFPPETRGYVKILDIGAGTGLAADSLKRECFVHIDALDPNEAMLNVARKFGRYENYFVECLTKDPCSIREGSYDVITACGVFAKSAHLETNALTNMIRLSKPGGIIVIVNRFTRNRSIICQVDSFMETLVAEKRLKEITREVWPDYNKITGDYGILWKYQVL